MSLLHHVMAKIERQKQPLMSFTHWEFNLPRDWVDVQAGSRNTIEARFWRDLPLPLLVGDHQISASLILCNRFPDSIGRLLVKKTGGAVNHVIDTFQLHLAILRHWVAFGDTLAEIRLKYWPSLSEIRESRAKSSVSFVEDPQGRNKQREIRATVWERSDVIDRPRRC